MPDPHHLIDTGYMEAVAVLRHALRLLDTLDLQREAALVSQALETMIAQGALAASVGAE